MALAVIHPGLFSTIQDQGRPGYRAFGVPSGGAFDRRSADLANTLLGNPADAAVLEMTLNGGQYEALEPIALALAGASLAVRIVSHEGRDTTHKLPVCFPLARHDRLILGGITRGARTYLAVLGGWQTTQVLGSRSSETPLKAGDVLPCQRGWTPVRHLDSPGSPGSAPLRVIVDGEAGLVEEPWFQSYRIGVQSNRMGLRLEGPAWSLASDPERESAPVVPGTVQVAGGQLLVLGVACGTMGGYPVVAHVISADLDRLGQARPGDLVRFSRVTLSEARHLDRLDRQERATSLARVAMAVSDFGPKVSF